jgi:hypothetical protein
MPKITIETEKVVASRVFNNNAGSPYITAQVKIALDDLSELETWKIEAKGRVQDSR